MALHEREVLHCHLDNMTSVVILFEESVQCRPHAIIEVVSVSFKIIKLLKIYWAPPVIHRVENLWLLGIEPGVLL